MLLARTKRSGFTLIEMVISMSIFVVIGYGLVVALKAGRNSAQAVHDISDADHGLRTATSKLIDELGSSADTQITVTTLADGNNQVRFLMPIDVGGNLVWGVYDRTFGSTPAAQNKANWSICYTVRSQVSNGKTTRELVRRILDDKQVVQKESVLMTGLCSGGVATPGFKIAKAGVLWQITVNTEGVLQGKTGLGAVFHVQAQNT